MNSFWIPFADRKPTETGAYLYWDGENEFVSCHWFNAEKKQWTQLMNGTGHAYIDPKYWAPIPQIHDDVEVRLHQLHEMITTEKAEQYEINLRQDELINGLAARLRVIETGQPVFTWAEMKVHTPSAGGHYLYFTDGHLSIKRYSPYYSQWYDENNQLIKPPELWAPVPQAPAASKGTEEC